MAGVLKPGDSYFPILPTGLTARSPEPVALPDSPVGQAVVLGEDSKDGGGGG